MENLKQPTPEKNIRLWKLATFIYAIAVFLNEYVNVFYGLGISEIIVNRIKAFGLFIYFIFTFYNFNQTPKNNEFPK